MQTGCAYGYIYRVWVTCGGTCVGLCVGHAMPRACVCVACGHTTARPCQTNTNAYAIILTVYIYKFNKHKYFIKYKARLVVYNN